MSSKQFLGTIKNIKVAGDYPDVELVFTVSVPLRSATDVAFLAAVKQHGVAVVEVSSAQTELPLTEEGLPKKDDALDEELAKAFTREHAPQTAGAKA